MDLIQQDKQLVITEISLSELSSMRKWTFFLSIMGFIGSAFMILFGLFFGVMSKFISQTNNTGKLPGVIMMLFYFILGVVYIFPSFFLFNFSSKIKIILETYSEAVFAEGLNFLRLHFKFMGIMIIVSIALVILGLIGVIIFAFIHAAHANI